MDSGEFRLNTGYMTWIASREIKLSSLILNRNVYMNGLNPDMNLSKLTSLDIGHNVLYSFDGLMEAKLLHLVRQIFYAC